jgi:hypothetical protein
MVSAGQRHDVIHGIGTDVAGDGLQDARHFGGIVTVEHEEALPKLDRIESLQSAMDRLF